MRGGNGVSLNTRRIVLSGYYGFDNLGDESILFTIINNLKHLGFEPVVLSGNPKKTSESFDVEAVDRMNITAVIKTLKNSDGLISGGGSLIQDATSKKSPIYYLGVIKIAQMLRKPVYFYAQGVGPINQKWLKPFIKHAVSRCAYISVRDEESFNLLKRIGIKKPIELDADPVFNISKFNHFKKTSFNSELSDFLKEKPILISLRKWHNSENVAIEVSNLINKLSKEHPFKFLFVPFHLNEDLTLLSEIEKLLSDKAKINSYFIKEELSINSYLSIFDSISLTVGVRLHSLIFAASKNIPFVGISYDPKIESFLKLYDEQPVFSIDNWDNTSLEKKILSILNEHDVFSEKIKQKNSIMAKEHKPGINFLQDGVHYEQFTRS